MNAPANIDLEEYIARSMAEMRARELGRGSIDAAVMALLAGAGKPLASHSIAEHLQFTRTAVAKVIDRLLASGKIVKSRAPGTNRKQFRYTIPISTPGSAMQLTECEAVVFSVFADGRERTLDDVARKISNPGEPLEFTIRRLVSKGAILSALVCKATVYRKNLSTPSGDAKNGVSA